MDIDLLSKMVKEIILDNDRVVLPGLGCFVAELVPSTFSDKGYTINPPYRKLYFRSRPDQGDELVKFYAASNKIEMEMADRIITDFVSELRSVLHVKKTVVFPGLGRLRATKENNVFFVADVDLDIYPDGFGLEPISLKTNQETPEEVSAAVVGLKSLLEEAVPAAAPVAVSVVEPQAVPTPESAVVSEPEVVQVPDEVAAPIPVVPEPEPVAVGKTEVVPETVPVQQSEIIAEPVVRPKSRVWKRIMWTMLIVAIVAAVLLGVFFLLSRLSPELLDSILYTKEELEILNYKL